MSLRSPDFADILGSTFSQIVAPSPQNDECKLHPTVLNKVPRALAFDKRVRIVSSPAFTERFFSVTVSLTCVVARRLPMATDHGPGCILCNSLHQPGTGWNAADRSLRGVPNTVRSFGQLDFVVRTLGHRRYNP